MTKIACLLLGLMLSVPLAAQKTYYMDPEGEDTNPGTESKPFATIIKVIEMMVKAHGCCRLFVLHFWRLGLFW